MHRSPDEIWKQIDSILGNLGDIRDSLAILLVACVKGATSPVRDHATHSLQTEFFSEQELAYIIGRLRSFGLFVRLFTSEMAFIEHVLERGMQVEGFNRTLVYNTAHSGSGPGRKALLPAFCDLNGLAYTGSNPHAATLARHKFHSACVLRDCGIDVPTSWFYIPDRGWAGGRTPPDGLKVIVKLTYESASIGLSSDSVLVSGTSLLDRLQALATQFDQPLTVQQFVSGREVEVPIVDVANGFAPLPVALTVDGSDALGDAILTYDLVNEDHFGFCDFGEISPAASEAVRADALQAAQIFGFRGLSRVDFRIDDAGRHFVTDLSTSPHIVPHSSFEFAFRYWEREGQLPVLLVALACKRLGWI
jgi:D-alanine-D-alanine ligase